MTLNQINYAIAISKERSLNEAAKKLFISQPSLTGAMHALEEELGFDIFVRSKNGISPTVKGAEFLGYARAVAEQYGVLDDKYIKKKDPKRYFSVSMQHYSFAVKAFVDLINKLGCEEYEFEAQETKTREIITNVKNQLSELGILYINDFNKKVLLKALEDEGLAFAELFECGIYAYISKTNPLAVKKVMSGDPVTLEELDDYPCLAFTQGEYNSVYYAEEVLSARHFKQLIRANDRATMLNLAKGVNGYTLCSGILCEELNGHDYVALKVDTDEKMTVGYIYRKDSIISDIGKEYIKLISQYRSKVLG